MMDVDTIFFRTMDMKYQGGIFVLYGLPGVYHLQPRVWPDLRSSINVSFGTGLLKR